MINRTGAKDCVIVGGGPAGLTAALYLARFLRSVTVFDAQEGRARLIPKTRNLGAFPDGISGRRLLERMQSHAGLFGVQMEPATVRTVERQGDLFHIKTDRRVESARSVIFACGVFNHRPPLSAKDHDLGLARGLIRYCPICDAYEIRGKRVAVLGTGAHGRDEARFVRHYSPSVTLIPPDGTLATAQDGIGVLDAPMQRLDVSDSAVLARLTTGEVYHFDTLYVALGTTARTDVAGRLGVRLGRGGSIVTDAHQRTSIDQVYAAGDITDGLDQIAVAMGQGAVAATAVHNDLNDMRSR